MADTAVPLAIAGVSHHTANVMTLEAFRFAGEEEFLAAARERFPVSSCCRPATGWR